MYKIISVHFPFISNMKSRVYIISIIGENKIHYPFWNFISVYNCVFGHTTSVSNNHWIHSKTNTFTIDITFCIAYRKIY